MTHYTSVRVSLLRAGSAAAPKPYTEPLQHAVEANRVWCADFKGWWKDGKGSRIDPLTISDARSRYLLRCQAIEKKDAERKRAIFEAAFREYGLPQAIRAHNVAPFASSGTAGLSPLAVSWMKLGITPVRIEAGTRNRTVGTSGCNARSSRTVRRCRIAGRSNAS